MDTKTLALLMQYVSMYKSISKVELKILLYLIPQLIENDEVELSQKIIGLDMRLSKTKVSAAIKKLVDIGILINAQNSKYNIKLKLKTYTVNELQKLLRNSNFDE